MNREHKDEPGGKLAGVRLNRLNVVMICIGLVLATLMAVSMYFAISPSICLNRQSRLCRAGRSGRPKRTNRR